MGPSVDSSRNFFEPVGIILRRLRKERGLRQIELAVEVAVDHSLVSRWETGSVSLTAKDVRNITSALSLTQEESDELRYAWRRDNEHLLPGELEAPVLHGVDGWIESLRVSIECVRALRKNGQPRIALMLSRRDARVALDRLRAQQWTSGHDRALIQVSELLLEECKASLDYLPPQAVRAGELNEMLRLQQLAARSADSDTARILHVLAREGVAYVSGNIGDAHNLGMSLLDNHEAIPTEWVPEVVRACGINAGKLADRQTMERTEVELGTLLTDRDDLPVGTRAFILEGFARGWSTIDTKRAEKVIEQAWELRGSAGDSEGASSVRYVQLVRSQAEIELSARSKGNIYDTLDKIDKALLISLREGYDKYVEELQRLGDKLS